MAHAHDIDHGFEVVSTRVFKTASERLFNAFGHSEDLSQWWGPRGFTNHFREFDLRPGGFWRFDMRGPDGATFPMEHRFVEVQRPYRVVFDHIQAGHNFRMTLAFAPEDAGTRMTWTMHFEPGAHPPGLADFIRKANEENFDRLESFLAGR